MVEKNKKYNYQILSNDYDKHDISFKILITGNSGVGKSKIILRVDSKQYDDSYNYTVGFEFFKFCIKINNKVVAIQIWDCCGAEMYRSLITNFYRKSSLVILVYAINNKETFNDINKWLIDINKYQEFSNFKFLIGNKCDLENERTVTINEGKNFAIENKFDLFTECSAKENINCENILLEAAFFLYEKHMNQYVKRETKILLDNLNINNITPSRILNKSFDIIIDKVNCNINISCKSEIITILIKEQNTLFQKHFEKKFKKNDFINIHKFFSEFKDIYQIYDKLCEFVNKKLIDGKIKEKELILKLNNEYNINIPIIENKEINIIEKMELLYKMYKELKDENKELKEKLNKQEKKNKKYENELKKLKENFPSLNQTLENNKNYFSESSIIINKEDKDLISNWIEEEQEKEFKLLFKSSKDGDLLKIFHEKCDNKGPTIIIIKSSNGKIFGGYNPLSWDESNKFKNDSNTFIFSLDTKAKYIIEKEEQKKYSIFCGKNAIGFGGGFDICIKDQFMKNSNNYSKTPTTFNTKNQYELTGELNFMITELEVYSVDYLN